MTLFSFSFLEEIMKSQNALISPHNIANGKLFSVIIVRIKYFQLKAVTGLNVAIWVVYDCGTSCYSNFQASSCISCVGDSYDTCGGCFYHLQQEKPR